MGSERKIAQLALDAIAARRIERALPARSQLRDHAARADVGEQLAQRSADRHARRDLGHHADVEALGVELAAGDVADFVLTPDDAHVALRPAQAVAGAKAELANGDAGPIVASSPHRCGRRPARTGAARPPCRGAARPRAGRGRPRRRVGWPSFSSNQPRSAPSPSLSSNGKVTWRRSSLTRRAAGRRRRWPLQRRQSLLRANSGCVEAAAPLKRSPHPTRRRRVEADLVVAQAVADDQLDVGERERLGAARLVDPAQRAGADHELVLPEDQSAAASSSAEPCLLRESSRRRGCGRSCRAARQGSRRRSGAARSAAGARAASAATRRRRRAAR